MRRLLLSVLLISVAFLGATGVSWWYSRSREVGISFNVHLEELYFGKEPSCLPRREWYALVIHLEQGAAPPLMQNYQLRLEEMGGEVLFDERVHVVESVFHDRREKTIGVSSIRLKEGREYTLTLRGGMYGIDRTLGTWVLKHCPG